MNFKELLGEGTEAVEFNAITQKILKEEAEKLRGTSEQAENWGALASQIVGARQKLMEGR